MNVSLDFDDSYLQNRAMIPKEKIIPFEDSYRLRTWTSGCYYYDESRRAWISSGMEIREAKYDATHCKSDHLTSFGTGFFVVPNSVDFDYIFANADFADNLTIYMVIILTALFYILLSMWAR